MLEKENKGLALSTEGKSIIKGLEGAGREKKKTAEQKIAA